MIEEVAEKKDFNNVSRRGFLKTMAAVGAAGAFAGCGSSSEDTIISGEPIGGIEPPDLKMNDWYYGTGGHNCHSKCASKIWVNEGRIIRVTSVADDARPGYDYNSDKPNGMQLACGKCRSYKYRLSHPGRLKYPLKQTKARGDLSGFIRVSWDQALNELARKHRAIYEKYGPEAMFIPCGSGAEGIGEQGGGYSGTLWGNSAYTGTSAVLSYLGGVQRFAGDVSYVQMYNWSSSYVGVASASIPSSPSPAANIASGKIKNLISFGENSMMTEHHTRQTKTAAYALARKNGTKVTYIAPEFVGEGINIADEFIPTKPGTTAALMIGMLHEMLINTFDTDGKIRSGTPGSNRNSAPWLDVEYIDLCVYGFFDSPEYTLRAAALANGYYEGTDTNRGLFIQAANHPDAADLTVNGAVLINKWKRERIDLWINTTDGTVVKTKPADVTDYIYQAYRWLRVSSNPATYAYTNPARTVNAVPPGMSWSAYIIGDEGGGTNRLMKARYDASLNYLAKAFASAPDYTHRNMALCSQPVAQGTNTAFIRKKEYRTPKTAEWASKITGIPAQRIKDLAWMYCNPAEHPIYHNRGNGMTKQIDGLMTMQVITAFFAVTKTVGMPLHGMDLGSTSSFGFGAVAGVNGSRAAAMPTLARTIPTTPVTPITVSSSFGAPPANVIEFGSPVICGTQWPNAVKMAFMDVMLDPAKGKGAYTAKYIPDYKPTADFKPHAESKDLANWKSYIGRVYQDYGGAKGLVKLARDTTTNPNTIFPYSGTALNESGTGRRLYQTDGGKPVYSGYRWIAMISSNSMGQIMNPNDTREMLESIPSCGQTNNPDNPDDLCIFSFDNFLSAMARWSDYVLPGQTQWEMATRTSANGQNILMPGIVEAPGESKDTWDFSVAFLRAYESVVPAMAGVANQFTGHDNVTGNNTPIPGDRLIDKYKRAYDRALMAGTATGFTEGGRYRGKTFEEALKVQYELPTPPAFTVGNPSIAETAPRTTYNAHTLGSIYYPNITTAQTWQGTMGFNEANMLYATSSAAYPVPPVPSDQSGRYHVYSEVLPWLYSKNYEGSHTYLRDQGLPTGQRPDDVEGDPIVPVIPMYFNYEDSFMQAYGGPARMQEMPEDRRFLITSAHPVLRAHSTHGESPLVRELTTRVRGGGEHSGNDWKTFALSEIGRDGKISRTNSAIDSANNFQKTDFKRASWIEVYMNEKDGDRLGIKEGDIIEMRNPIGAVRVAVKLTRRVAKGTIALEQGGWYDPDPADGVDDGGCVNTLMPTKGSWLDHGNGCSFAVVSIKKVF